VNPTSGATSPPASAGTDAATGGFPHDPAWPGLEDASGEIGVPVDALARERFARYRDLLLERGARFNLTAIRDPLEIERRLFLDALAMIPALDHIFASANGAERWPVRLIDIGSGAGFPGLALKIARPALDVTLVDATAKKTAFLTEAIETLGLQSITAVHGRAEELGQDPAYRATFDVGTARAVASLPTLLEYVVPFLVVGGAAFLPKGLEIDDELRVGRRAAATLGAEIVSSERLSVPTTRLIIARKTAPTPAVYPRRTGLPSREPLGARH
jgi:16S rRNA (guanine527-N7)-methyltransferase